MVPIDELRTAALLLRFRSTRPTVGADRFMSYAKIARALSITYNEAQHLIRQALKPKKPLTFDQRARLLDREHIEFLTSPSTLESWAGRTMKWRTILFHRRFPDKRIAVTSLRKLYLKHKVKRKRVR